MSCARSCTQTINAFSFKSYVKKGGSRAMIWMRQNWNFLSSAFITGIALLHSNLTLFNCILILHCILTFSLRLLLR